MRRGLQVVVIMALLAGSAALALFLWERSHRGALPPPPVAQAPAPPPAAVGPRNPLEPVPPEKPLPPLRSSDPDVREALANALPPSALERLVLEDFIRRVVATVDNLPREQYAARLNPVAPAGGLPKTTGQGEMLAWGDNAARYAPFMAALDATDTDRVLGFYRRYYPLFQEAYVELGYPQGYFNDRVVEVIDHLLEAPDPGAAPRLAQPKVLYQFADPQLEERSAGQKALMRLGSANAAKVKARLRELRAKLAAR
jgi:hypothetical protein